MSCLKFLNNAIKCEQRKKMKKSKESPCDVLDSNERTNINKNQEFKGKEREKGDKNLIKVVRTEKFLNLG